MAPRTARVLPSLLLPLWAVLGGVCSAQTVRIENLGGVAFTGWKRTTIDSVPPHLVGQVGGALYVVGRQVGLETHAVDVHVSLDAGQSVSLNLAAATPAAWTRGPYPADPLAWFGGPVSIGGQAMSIVSIGPDGAGYTARLRKRTGPMLCTETWITWYPDHPEFAFAEAIVACSNPTVPDMGATAPPNFHLRFGDAITFIPGAGGDVPLIAAGASFADGQMRAMPVVFLWTRHCTQWAQVLSAAVVVNLKLGAVGISKVLADGNPRYPPSFAARPWTLAKLAPATMRLHSWGPPLIGANAASGDSGAQEDQVFVRGEAMLEGGVGAEIVTYISALKLANRPCHHFEANGSLLNLAQHVNPLLVFWDGRPHWSPVVSPDRLGKPFGLSPGEANNWWGPDVEHALFNTLAAGVRYTGSYALQQILAEVARIYLLQWTVQSGLSTSQPFASRAIGWEGVLAVHLWRELEDRQLATAVRQRWRDRLDFIVGPFLEARPNDVWDLRFDDARLGPGWRWQPWQQAVGAYGLDLAGTQLDRWWARTLALRGAKAVIRDAYVFQNGAWTSRDVVALDNAPVSMGFYDLFGMPLAPATVLRHEWQHWPARPIWTQLQTQCSLPKHTAWLAPGVQ